MNMEEKVRISQTSRHFKAVNWMFDNPLWKPYHDIDEWKTLCVYGRKLLFSLFIFYPFIFPFLLPGLLFEKITRKWINDVDRSGISLVFQWFFWSVFIFYGWYQARTKYGWSGLLLEGAPWYLQVLDAIATLNIIIIIVAVVLFCYFIIFKPIKENLEEKWVSFVEKFVDLREKKNGESAITIIVKTYRAWKNKICPLIEFVD